MLKEKPDVGAAGRLTSPLPPRRRQLFGQPGGPGSLGATYFATIILRWLRLLDGKPPVLEPAAFAPLFNGTDLAGWEGNTVALVGPRRHARGQVSRARSQRVPGHAAAVTATSSSRSVSAWWTARATAASSSAACAFPAPRCRATRPIIGENYWGCLYDESRRNKVLVKASPEALKALKKDGWNHYVLYAMGDRITLYLNGVASVVYREEEPGIARDGLIAVQIHAGARWRSSSRTSRSGRCRDGQSRSARVHPRP